LDGPVTVLYKNGIVKQNLYYINGLLDGVVSTYAPDGKITTEEHYIHGNLTSHNEFGDKASYVAKNNTASNSAAPAPNNAPAPADAPTKL
jgi:antitoxin component YwqK of YwqJK toxin-antitoxin module